MKTQDVMVCDVLTIKPDADVADAIKLLAEHDISALQVIAVDGRLVGLLSEAGLLARAENLFSDCRSIRQWQFPWRPCPGW